MHEQRGPLGILKFIRLRDPPRAPSVPNATSFTVRRRMQILPHLQSKVG